MPLYMTACFAVKPEAVEKCQRAIREFVGHVKANEPQTRLYVSVQEEEDQTRFLHFFIFEDESAQERHANSEAVKRFTSVLYAETLVPVEFTRYALVASTTDN